MEKLELGKPMPPLKPAAYSDAVRMLTNLKEEEARISTRLAHISAERDLVISQVTIPMLRELLFECAACGDPAPLHRWVLSRARHYVPPRGCTEGDYWVTCELHYSRLQCPLCEEWNRLYDHPQREHILLFLNRIEHILDSIFDASIEQHEQW